MLTDQPLSALTRHESCQADPPDFDDFWNETLAESRCHPLIHRVTRVDAGVVTMDVYDVRFGAFAGEEISAWLRVPRGVPAGKSHAIVQYHGYGRGRGEAHENLLWASAGFVHFEMDTRGQGWRGFRGDTPDTGSPSPHTPGFLRGILDKHDYYYRRLFTDAVRAVEALRAIDLVEVDGVLLHGSSQGGAIALAVAGLVADIDVVVARVPFLSDIAHAIEITDHYPYREIVDFLAQYRGETDRVLETLTYFDVVNFSKRAKARAVFTSALMDPVCPPSTVFAAYNAYAGAKTMKTWKYNAHEGGGSHDDLLVLEEMRGMRQVRRRHES